MHHDVHADLTPWPFTVYPPTEHMEGEVSDWGFSCEHSKEEIVQSCDQCSATMTMAITQGGPESPNNMLDIQVRLTYDFALSIRLDNPAHVCDVRKNPACKAAAHVAAAEKKAE